MRSFLCLVFLGLFLAVNGSPQLRSKLTEKLLENSPCGEGVKPVTCKCDDGVEFTPGEGRPACRPSNIESCTCPNGETVDVDPKAALQKKLLSKSPCGEGVKPLVCKCIDGDEFTPGEGIPACRPTKFESCTCPNGETVDIDLKAALKKKLLSKSPCGENIKPNSCLCADDSTIVPGSDEKCPTGWPVTCQCPDGTTHEIAKKINEKKEQFKEKVLAESPCGAGVAPSECSCENGETFTPGESGSSALWGSACKGPPNSCT